MVFTLKDKVTYFAITTRLGVIVLSTLSNAMLPDHMPSDVFVVPKLQNGDTWVDNLVDILFGGLLRWDAQYFTHISLYGYTYENTLAFFPLYPLIIYALAMPLHYLLPCLNCNSITIISAVTFNFLIFIKTSAIVYDLSLSLFKSERIAYKAAIFYCVNPASIFFTAPYSEACFSFLSFYGMNSCLNGKLWKCCLAIGLSAATRSNGLLNVGFVVHKILKSSAKQGVKNQSFIVLLQRGISTLSSLAIYSLVSMIPFIAFQLYGYVLFCKIQKSTVINVNKIIVDYGKQNNLILPGQEELPWCSHKLPLSYHYVQNHYWNVGFLNYYHWKQIPNFILAAPIIYSTLYMAFIYLRQNKNAILCLGLNHKPVGRYKGMNNPEIFVFVIHILALTLFCIFFVHIQVTTRMLASSSPVLYWFLAYMCDKDVNTEVYDVCSRQKVDVRCERQHNLNSYWKVFIFDRKMFNVEGEIIRSYCLAYLVIGSILFSNFFPWT